MKFAANVLRFFCVGMFCGAALNLPAAVSINYVGSALLADFRTTSVLKPLDADGDNVFGTAGYVFYGTDVNGNSSAGRVAAGDPLTYASGTISTKLSLPPWLALSNNGQNNTAASYPSYPLIDDPAVLPGPAVADVQLGLAVRIPNSLGTEGSVVDILFGESMPAGGVRIGVVCFATSGDAIDVVRLTSSSGPNSSANRAGAAGPTIYFFDVVGAALEENVTVHLTKNPATGGNANVSYVGLTFDVLPSGPVPPSVSITQPVDESAYPAPFNTVMTASATAGSAAITNVAFYVNGTKLANDRFPPYSAAWNTVPAGNYFLFAEATDAAGLTGTSSVVKVTVTNWPPTISGQSPVPGTLTNLSAITVVFIKPVQGVNAGDFLVNGVAATNFTGAGSTYTFQFAPPAYGPVSISWSETHGITDTSSPPTAFDRLGAGATWSYYLRGTPRVTAWQVTNGVFQLCWESSQNDRYRVETTSALPATNWTHVMTNIIATGTNTCVSGATTPAPAFYRVVAY